MATPDMPSYAEVEVEYEPVLVPEMLQAAPRLAVPPAYWFGAVSADERRLWQLASSRRPTQLSETKDR
jgi:hypothetical protein